MSVWNEGLQLSRVVVVEETICGRKKVCCCFRGESWRSATAVFL